MTNLDQHPDVARTEQDDAVLRVHLSSSRSHAISNVTSVAVDAGFVPREVRRTRHGILLILADNIDGLPMDNSSRRHVLTF